MRELTANGAIDAGTGEVEEGRAGREAGHAASGRQPREVVRAWRQVARVPADMRFQRLLQGEMHEEQRVPGAPLPEQFGPDIGPDTHKTGQLRRGWSDHVQFALLSQFTTATLPSGRRSDSVAPAPVPRSWGAPVVR